MYRISELADLVGLSRTALLYYEKLELICAKRLSNGYRVYNDRDVQRIRLIQQLQAGGLTLKECQACLEAKVDRALLKKRLDHLDQEIEHKQQSRRLLAALLGEGVQHEWHDTLSEVAPDAHLDWLITQGFNEKEALRLKWLSKDMNEHDKYMADFMKVFETLERWGPGSEEETRKALSLLPKTPETILEIGSGKGLSTRVLAKHTAAAITAVDNELSAINKLNDTMQKEGLSEQVSPVCASMTELPFDERSFDLIWAEGCAYIMGTENALKEWKPLLKESGLLVISDLVWLTDEPHPESAAFWKSEYPDIQTIETRLAQIKAAGYQTLQQFTISLDAWRNYFMPLQARVDELKPDMADSAAIKDISKELDIYHNHLGDEFGYHFFIVQKLS